MFSSKYQVKKDFNHQCMLFSNNNTYLSTLYMYSICYVFKQLKPVIRNLRNNTRITILMINYTQKVTHADTLLSFEIALCSIITTLTFR